MPENRFQLLSPNHFIKTEINVLHYLLCVLIIYFFLLVTLKIIKRKKDNKKGVF